MFSPIRFNQTDVESIMISIMKLHAQQNMANLLEKKLTPHTIKKTLKRYEPFEIKVNDGLKGAEKEFNPNTDFICAPNLFEREILYMIQSGISKDEAEKIILDRQNNCDTIQIIMQETAYTFIGPKNLPMTKCRIWVMPNLLLIPREKSEDTFPKYIGDNLEKRMILIQNILWAVEAFINSNQRISQKALDDIIIHNHKKMSLDNLNKTMFIPFCHLVEHTRQFLVDVLVKHHALQIASTPEEVKKHLRDNKEDIFRLSEQFGYIPNAQKMIDYMELRNQIMHPYQEKQTLVFPPNSYQIQRDFLDMVSCLTHNPYLIIGQNLSKTLDSTPVFSYDAKTIHDKFNHLMQAGLLFRRMDLLDSIFKEYEPDNPPKNRKKARQMQQQALINAGLLDNQDLPLLQANTLNRNETAHGTSDATTYVEIISDKEHMNRLEDRIVSHHYMNQTLKKYDTQNTHA